jgi:hypothetical protein
MPEYIIYIITHIDNFKIYISIRKIIDAAKEKIMILFLIKNIGSIVYYLELQVERNR